MNEQLINYIRQYRFTYTREAISSELLKQGHSQEEIDAAWQAVEASAGQVPPPGPFPYQGQANYQTPVAPPNQPTQPPANRPVFQQLPPYQQPQSPFPYRPRPRLRSNPRFWLAFFGYIVAVYVITYILGFITNGALVVPFFMLAFVGALVVGFRLQRTDENYPVGQGLIYGMVTALVAPFVLGFIFVVIIAGICIVGGTRF